MHEVTSHRRSREYFIYLVISETPSRFGKLIRRFAKLKYNHASIAFDESLIQLYSFGRRQNKVPLNAGLVREYPERFSLKKAPRVNVRIFKIPVSREQYILGKKRILQIRRDADEYLYNLFSVLLFPFAHGFHTYKAYTCAEFTVHMLRYMGIELSMKKSDYQYTPDDIGKCLNSYIFYEGDLLKYCICSKCSPGNFFENPEYIHAAKITLSVLFRLLYRKVRFRNKYAPRMIQTG